MTRATTIIAIVDDDVSMLTSTARLLAVHGFGTQTFVSAEAFLDCESAARPDCLILDINLGGISGIDASAADSGRVPYPGDLHHCVGR